MSIADRKRAAAALLIALAGIAGCKPPPEGPAVEAMSLLDAGAAEHFARALEPGAIRFPVDHGPHPAYRTEWWYFTGNLRAPEGRHFGFELTFFRFALGEAARLAR